MAHSAISGGNLHWVGNITPRQMNAVSITRVHTTGAGILCHYEPCHLVNCQTLSVLAPSSTRVGYLHLHKRYFIQIHRRVFSYVVRRPHIPLALMDQRLILCCGGELMIVMRSYATSTGRQRGQGRSKSANIHCHLAFALLRNYNSEKTLGPNGVEACPES